MRTANPPCAGAALRDAQCSTVIEIKALGRALFLYNLNTEKRTVEKTTGQENKLV